MDFEPSCKIEGGINLEKMDRDIDTCGVIPFALIAAATQQKQWYTAERDETVALFYLLNLY